MNVANALSLWDWPTALGLAISGFTFGWLAVPMAWPQRRANHESLPVAIAGFLMVLMFAVAFVFLIAFRYFTGPVAVAERTIGTALELLLFAASAGLGLRFTSPPAHTTAQINAEIAARAADLLMERNAAFKRLADAIAENTALTQRASDNADRAHDAATAARDEIAVQGQTIIEQGQDAAAVAELGVDTNQVAHRIDERVP